MSRLLRKIDRRQLLQDWDVANLGPNNCPADSLQLIKTVSQKFSVFKVGNDPELLDRTIAALASQRDKLDRFQYIVFDPTLLSDVNALCERTSGQTPDSLVNENHFDVIDLTGVTLTHLVARLYQHADIDTHIPKKVGQKIANSLAKGYLEVGCLTAGVRRKLEIFNLL